MTGLYYLRARQYDTLTGRFTQEDTYLGDGRNLYVYVSNNPLKYVDPSGHGKQDEDDEEDKNKFLNPIGILPWLLLPNGSILPDIDINLSPFGILNNDVLDLIESGGNADSIYESVNNAGEATVGERGGGGRPGGGQRGGGGRPGNNSRFNPEDDVYVRTGEGGNSETESRSNGRPGIGSRPVGERGNDGISGEEVYFRNAESISEDKENSYRNSLMAEGLIESSENIVRNGAIRAAQYSSEWESASLQEAISKFASNVEPVVTSSGKIIYNNQETGISVVYDVYGNYFRIEDTTRPRGRNYLDMDGNDMNNETINGKTKGRSRSDYQRVTHFNNSDN